MIDFIPIEYYTSFYYNILLLIVIITWFHTEFYSGNTNKTYFFSKIFSKILFIFVLLYMGLRPISWYFGDMGGYAKQYIVYAKGWELERNTDLLFYGMMKGLSSFNSTTLYFFVIAFLYITTLYIATKRIFKQYYYFGFLILVVSFEFWSYGTNGIRNGLATSLMILAFAFMNKKWIMYLLFLIAFNIHSSVMIPIMAYFGSAKIKNPKFYFYVWIFAILLSSTLGETLENLIINLGIMREDVVETYFKNKDLYVSSFSHSGFRWDFLLYSSLAVVISYYFIFIKKIKDTYYHRLVYIFLLSNTAWILVIKASFSNRFAYLSWFMMGLVMIYPLLYPFIKKANGRYKFAWVGRLILFYYLFTYIMKFILPNL